jgi:heterodisulfide reductase subunit A-like polyferredoxin
MTLLYIKCWSKCLEQKKLSRALNFCELNNVMADNEKSSHPTTSRTNSNVEEVSHMVGNDHQWITQNTTLEQNMQCRNCDTVFDQSMKSMYQHDNKNSLW